MSTVTVAIPSYNSDKFIIYTIRSVLKQTKKIDQIVVVDNKSTDNTVQMVQKIINENPNRNIQLMINKPNLGYQHNWNKCLENATSEYVLILHADDILKPDTIEKQINFFKNHPECALVGGQEDFINEKGKIVRYAKRKENKIYQNGQIYEFVSETGSYIPCSSVMFNMEKIKQVGFFDTDVLATDELFWSKILTQFPITTLGESLILRRLHPEQTEHIDFQTKFKQITSACIIHQQRIPLYELRIEKRKLLKKILKYKYSVNSIGIALKVVKYYKNYLLSVKYILFGIYNYPAILLRKTFYKKLILVALTTLNIYPRN